MYSKLKALKEKPETANAGSRWSEDEVKTLLNEIKDKKNMTDIATNHKRTLGSIIGKLLSIAEQLINEDNMNINDASKKVNLPVADINEHLLKVKNKPKAKKKTKNINIDDEIIEEEEEEKKELILNFEQKYALKSFQEGNSIFLTGPAGTGKSVTLKKMIEHCEMEGNANGVTATTGSAAFLIGGKTIHSYLSLGLAKDSAKEIFEYTRRNRPHTIKKIRALKVLIIDEISMLDIELFDKVSEYLSLARYNSKPFGGLQLVLTGDFCQLEPVNGDYCFKSELWEKLNLDIIYLNKMVRQDGDKKFQKMLMQLRYGKCTDKTFESLLKLKDNKITTIKPTILYPNKWNVEKINSAEYKKLIDSGAEKKVYEVQLPTVKKNKDKATTWLKTLDIPESIELCVGSQVVVTTNIDQEKGIVNGTRGCITELKNKSVMIKKVNGSLFEIEYHKNISIEDKDVYICQMPLKLAYALTIHKSQGMTLDAIEIDIGENTFAAGQAYTALSRAQSLKSVCIKSISKKSFITKDSVLEFYKKIEDDIVTKNNKYVQSIIDKLIENLNEEVNVENTLNFIWEFVSGDDSETMKYFDDFKLDDKLESKLENIKQYMLADLELVSNKLNECDIVI
jgi:ATP-dependent DNA helicase PIF1